MEGRRKQFCQQTMFVCVCLAPEIEHSNFVPSKTYLRLQRSSACAAVRAAWAMDTPAATFGDKHGEAIVLEFNGLV